MVDSRRSTTDNIYDVYTVSKKLTYRNLIYTELHFLNFFKLQEEKFIILIVFFLLITDIKTIFSQHVQISRNFMSKV